MRRVCAVSRGAARTTQLLLAAEVLDVVLGNHPAGVDDPDPVADLLHLAEQVPGQQHGPAVGAEFADQPAHVAHPGGVEAIGRLVQDHQLRVLQERGRDAEPLLHPQGVRREPVPRAFGEVDQLQHLVDLLSRHFGVLGQQTQVVQAGEVRIERGRLDHRPDPPQYVGLSGTTTEHPYVTTRRRDDPGQNPQRGRLARPVRTQKPVNLPRQNRQVDTIHREGVAVPLRQPCDLDQRIHTPSVPVADRVRRRPGGVTAPTALGVQALAPGGCFMVTRVRRAVGQG